MPQQSPDFSAELLNGRGDFQRAQQMNFSLIALYKLLAQGRISPRQAAVLAYIGSLVLRSLKDVDYDSTASQQSPIMDRMKSRATSRAAN